MSSVAVIIAAKNASATVVEAVRSALAEPEVRRVVLVDDGSTDATGTDARIADDGTGRLQVIRFDASRGPAAARNAAFQVVREEFVAVLDADDRFLPGRIGRLLAVLPFDMVADNILFVRESAPLAHNPAHLEALLAEIGNKTDEGRDLTLADFVKGNITRVGKPRAELGFLKPMMRTSLLRSVDGPWNATMRLGEDYELYVRLLLAGARFKITDNCGYFALERAASLSGRHSVEDLWHFSDADRPIIERRELDKHTRRVAELHSRQSRARFEHRRFLEEKASCGLARAGMRFLGRPHTWASITLGIGRDKLEALLRRSRRLAEYRLLFDPGRPPKDVGARGMQPDRTRIRRET